MIHPNFGPWYVGLSIFEFGFDFAEIFFLINQHFILQIFSFMIDVFTPKRISSDCPFKSNQRLTDISILTPRCDAHQGAWLRCGKHNAELESAMGCTPGSFLRKFWSFDSAVWCAPLSQTSSNMSVFRDFVFLTLFDSVFLKNFWTKRDSLKGQ